MESTLAFVAGATGYTGREVVRVLRERGIATVAHVRPGSRDLAGWRERFTALGAEVDSTAWEPGEIAATIAARRPTLIFALLGTTRSRAKREGLTDAYERVDYGLTRQLLDAALAAGHAPRFVYLSAMGAREDTRNAYVEVRGRLEREIRASGLPHVLVRPAFITGSDREESRPAERIAAGVLGALLGALAAVGIPGPRERYGTLSGRELAAGMVEVALGARDAAVVAEVADLKRALRGGRA